MNSSLMLASVNPLEHVLDHPWWEPLDGLTLWSNHTIMLLVSAVIVCLVLPRVARQKASVDEVERHTPTGFRNAIEGICQFLRDKVAKPNLGEHTDRFIPYLWTAFFFILCCNLIGLLPLEPLTKSTLGLPIYGTATSNVFVTGTLAFCTLFTIVVSGLRLHGMAYLKHFFMGPFPINLLIAFLEMIGLVVKSGALMIRLAANMTAGHILLAVLLSFIQMAGSSSRGLGLAVSVPVILGSVAINLLEIFVAFLQAFIFMFLSAVFIGMAVNIHHERAEQHPEDAAGETAATESH